MKKIIKVTLKFLSCILFIVLCFPIGYFVLPKAQNIIDDVATPHDTVSYVINLERSIGRLQYVMPNIKKLGYKVQVISAVDGKQLSDDKIHEQTDQHMYRNFFNYYPPKGTIGCFLSHIKVWETFLKSEHEFAVIFEDDVSFDPAKLKSVIEQLTTGKKYWDITSFEMSHRGNPLTLNTLHSDQKHVIFLYKVSHSGAYIINRKAAKKLLEKSLPIMMPIDHYFIRSWELGLKFTGIEPRIVHQSYGDSEICEVNRLNNEQEYKALYLRLYKYMFNIQTNLVNFFYNLKIYLYYKYEQLRLT
ncbi:MAG: glycosyltransferase family 25 protein [Rickettsiaceae bacterium]|nr:MAG: glycosyltransferase family 25 protein [Rickettsiaceae bacterium]